MEVSDAFRTTFPGAKLGLLAMTGVNNPAAHPLLEERKAGVEAELRQRYAGFERAMFKELPVIQAYDAYYRKFDKTYHVLPQLESAVLKGKAIPSVAALVEAMFMAELKNMLLTAGHDLDKVVQPLTLGATNGGETYTGIRGKLESCKAGDMVISDGGGVISSVLYGPDHRTRITPGTGNVLFTVYVPAGIAEDEVYNHLRDMEEYVRLVSPEAVTTELTVLS
jgi:DNA/RNA-binding domain of Phe-tRNA-synthetase-like protein